MQETHLLSISNTKSLSFSPSFPNPKPQFPHDFPSLSSPQNLNFPSLSSKANTPLPHKPIKTLEISSTSPTLPTKTNQPNSDFQEKMLYLDSIGIDSFSLINDHPPLLCASLNDIKSTVAHLTSTGFTSIELRRIIGMCPEILTTRVSDIIPVFTFLIREARINGSDLKRVINRRPRLLVCSVKNRLRPTLYFLQSIGISEVNKHTHLLSCSVEEKLLSRIDYFERIGFSHRDAISMFRRFPQLFCYSIEDNFEPKFDYFMVEMGRDLKELKEFPQYFSFSLQNRIKPRHQYCVENGVCFPLPILLKMNETQFRNRLEVCCDSSMPFTTSPLWCTNYEHDSL